MLDNRDLVLNLVHVLLYNKLISDLHLFQCNVRIALTFVLYLKLMKILKLKCLFLKKTYIFFCFISEKKTGEYKRSLTRKYNIHV